MNKQGPKKIPYLDYTWNPVTGCTPISKGCKNCWAKSLIDRGLFDYDFTPRFHLDRLAGPSTIKKPSRIGVCFMGDLFHIDAMRGWRIDGEARGIGEVLTAMENAPQHTYVILTKRPENMHHFFRPVREDVKKLNLWLGVSVEDQATADERIPELLKCRPYASKLWVSAEPLLESVFIDLLTPIGGKNCEDKGTDGCCESDNQLTPECHEGACPRGLKQGIDWVVAGCESGSKRRPADREWFRSLKNQCVNAGVPFYLKQMEVTNFSTSKVVSLPELDGRTWEEMP